MEAKFLRPIHLRCVFLLPIAILPVRRWNRSRGHLIRPAPSPQPTADRPLASPRESVYSEYITPRGTSVLAPGTSPVQPVSHQEPAVKTASAQEQVPVPLPASEGGTSVGGNAMGLTLAELEQIALQNNPTLRQAGNLIQRAQGNWTQVGLYPNPTAGYVAGEIGNDGDAG